MFDNRRIAVNIGEEAGVSAGDRIDIYTPDSEVRDPETGEVLGAYRQRKAVLYAREVFAKFSVAYPRDREIVERDPVVTMNPFAARTVRTEPGEVPVEPSEVESLPTGPRVRLGDIAVSVPAKKAASA